MKSDPCETIIDQDYRIPTVNYIFLDEFRSFFDTFNFDLSTIRTNYRFTGKTSG